MFAVIAFGGKQYKVKPNYITDMEKIDAEVGAMVNFEDVVFVVGEDNQVSVGKKAIVSGIVSKQYRDKKIRVFKKRQRTSGFEKKYGHRQYLTSVLIKEINFK